MTAENCDSMENEKVYEIVAIFMKSQPTSEEVLYQTAFKFSRLYTSILFQANRDNA